MISFPALVGLGLPAVAANATNTLGIWPGNLGSAWGFRRELARVEPRFRWLLVPAMIGSICGAIALTMTPKSLFDWLVPWLLLFATVLFIVQAPIRRRLEAWIGKHESGTAASGKWMSIACGLQFCVGVYGGYFGAGMSIMTLAILGVVGMTDILEMNALTAIVSGATNGVAGVLFIFAHLIRWPYVIAMAAGAVLGGWRAAGAARKIGKVRMRQFVIFVGATIAAVMFLRQVGRNVSAELALDFLRPSTFPGAVCYAVVFAVAAFFVARLAKGAFDKLILRDSALRTDRTVLLFLNQLVTVVIYVLALVFYVHLVPALNHLGTALLTSVSIVSVVVGLAAQPTLGNMVSGIALLLYRPFHVGNRVQITAPNGLETAVVESLTLGYTKLRTADNRCIIVPNSVMAGQVVIEVPDKTPNDGSST
jgi:uncharacterized protein